ncbi:dihydroorotate dehydrogenase [Stylonychia lemnae]|uniref:Dihydroorotate dehydrogenase n=1 Tax=Stylonychia lemnae TaxID=5949 RepID=A0A078AZD6_STYLE|nr:dihydroorotate dehydrogenase [Stylonychia lemnae]|eukprot:CDW86567.1 dihydroorotate dehydrogenase [Stylonychia lemnae]
MLSSQIQIITFTRQKFRPIDQCIFALNVQLSIQLQVITKSGYRFNNPIGLGPNFDQKGQGIDCLHQTGLSFVEIGSGTLEQQNPHKLRTKVISIDLKNRDVKQIFQGVTPSLNLIVSNLVRRQTAIRDQKISPVINSIIGVNVQANLDTQRSIPYLTHTDFTKNIRELNDLCDYVVLNLTEDANSNGLSQYYKNEKALEKLISESVKARNSELGKLAALEYELADQDLYRDYTFSLRRYYQRNSMISTLKPMMIFLQISLNYVQDKQKFLATIISKCKIHGIDGIVLQDDSVENTKNLIKKFRELDSNKDLLLITQTKTMTGQQLYDQIKLGADLVQIYDKIVLDGPYATNDLLHELQEIMRLNGLKDVKLLYQKN